MCLNGGGRGDVVFLIREWSYVLGEWMANFSVR